MATHEHEAEIARLQGRLTDDLARLDALPPGDPGYEAAADQVIAAAQELTAYEERMPRLLDEQPRQLTLVLLRGAGAATMAVAAAIALGVIPADRPWWWLLVAVLLAMAGARLLMTRVRRSALGSGGHLQQRLPAALVLAGALAAALADLGLATPWLLAASAVLVTGGLALLMPRPAVQFQDLSTGQRLEADLGPSAGATTAEPQEHR